MHGTYQLIGIIFVSLLLYTTLWIPTIRSSQAAMQSKLEINPSFLHFPCFPTVLFLWSVFHFNIYKIQKIKKKAQSKSPPKQNKLLCANKIAHLRGWGRYLGYKAIFVPATSALSSLMFVLWPFEIQFQVVLYHISIGCIINSKRMFSIGICYFHQMSKLDICYLYLVLVYHSYWDFVSSYLILISTVTSCVANKINRQVSVI